MFWMKKLAVGAMFATFVAGGLFAGSRRRSDGVARATEPLVIETEPPTVDADTVRKQVVAKLDELARQKAELDQLTADLNAQLAEIRRGIPG